MEGCAGHLCLQSPISLGKMDLCLERVRQGVGRPIYKRERHIPLREQHRIPGEVRTVNTEGRALRAPWQDSKAAAPRAQMPPKTQRQKQNSVSFSTSKPLRGRLPSATLTPEFSVAPSALRGVRAPKGSTQGPPPRAPPQTLCLTHLPW